MTDNNNSASDKTNQQKRLSCHLLDTLCYYMKQSEPLKYYSVLIY